MIGPWHRHSAVALHGALLLGWGRGPSRTASAPKNRLTAVRPRGSRRATLQTGDLRTVTGGTGHNATGCDAMRRGRGARQLFVCLVPGIGGARKERWTGLIWPVESMMVRNSKTGRSTRWVWVLLLAGTGMGCRSTADRPIPPSIHSAARLGHLDGVAHYLRRGVDIDEPDSVRTQTALHYAAERGHEHVVELLLDKGANTEAANFAQETALHLASRKGHVSVVRLLLSGGARPGAAESSGSQPLHLAADGGQTEVVRLLLGANADVNARTESRETPLHFACSGARGWLSPSDGAGTARNKAVAELLLANGADVAATDDNGWTPLHAAARNGYRDAAASLLKHGAQIGARGTGSALTGVLSRAPQALRVHNEEDMVHALRHGRKPGLGELVEGVLVDDLRSAIRIWVTPVGAMPLHVAAVHGQTSVAKLLLEAGAKVDDEAGPLRWRPIHLAARNGHAGMVRLLLSAGADANASRRHSPLALAAEGGHHEIVKLLKQHGAK